MGKTLYKKHVFGYVSIDFVAFVNHENALKLWGIDISLRLTDNAIMHRMFDFIVGYVAQLCTTNFDSGKMDEISGEYMKHNMKMYNTKQKKQYFSHQSLDDMSDVTSDTVSVASSVNTQELLQLKKSYVYSGLMRHPAFSSWRHAAFFNMCKQKNLSFDLKNRIGVVFQLVDTLLKGMLGSLYGYKTLLTFSSVIANSTNEAIVKFGDVIDFIASQTQDDMLKALDADSNLQSVHFAAKTLISQAIRKQVKQS